MTDECLHCGPCATRCDDCPVAWERFKPAPPASPEDSERWWRWVARVLRVEYQQHHLDSAEDLRHSLLRAATACESAAARRPIQPPPPIACPTCGWLCGHDIGCPNDPAYP